MRVYRILPAEVWERVKEEIPLATIDEKDGFIHLSTKDQVRQTANLYFPPETRPVVLCFDSETFGTKLQWEKVEARGGAAFPHLYDRRLRREDVCAVIELQHDGEGYTSFSDE